ncbi:MAG: 3-methyl-2-oxobutanoate hydroxymethyltransferase [Nitrospirae bacterium]|nr:3-methyl-2-oxobutanoate hydroxymethyltransferase [Nitrospirota bacterium]
MENEKITVPKILRLKQEKKKIVALTAYDCLMARLVDEAGVDVILVGDSVGSVFSGYDSTLPVTLDEMLYHTRAVARARPRALLVMDMPFLSYQCGPDDAVRNCGRALKEGGAVAVKIEGGVAMAPTVRRLVEVGIPVMGHVGLTPQSIHQMGGYKVQGREEQDRKRILADALALQDAGAFSVVLECVPAILARDITRELRIPTIGIGAGADCDGQILVIHDLVGLTVNFTPRFVRRYAELGRELGRAVREYATDVREGRFPTPDQAF